MRFESTAVLLCVVVLVTLATGCGNTNGSPCTTGADCASGNCVKHGNPDAGVCCVPGGCP